MSVQIEDQISPDDEVCARCDSLGQPSTIPAGEEYKRFFDGVTESNCCAACWNRLQEECQS